MDTSHTSATERYLEEASAVNADESGRVNMGIQKAAALGFVDDMVSTDTQELEF